MFPDLSRALRDVLSGGHGLARPNGAYCACLLARWLRHQTAYQISRLFRDHERGGVRVRADDARHLLRIRHPQTLDAMHAQLWIDHRQLVDAHLAGADGVVAGAAIRLRIGFALGPRGPLVAREVHAREVLAQGALAHDFPPLAYALDGNLEVVRIENIRPMGLRRI